MGAKNDGSTAVFLAVESRNLSVLKILIEGKADIRRTNAGGKLPVQLASGEVAALIRAEVFRLEKEDAAAAAAAAGSEAGEEDATAKAAAAETAETVAAAADAAAAA